MLELIHVNASYHSAPVVQGVSMRVETGETVALIGPNGAGKSTLLGAISGTVPQRHGQVLLDGVDLMPLYSHDIVALGVVQVPEGRHVFAPMTVQDNLLLGSVALKDRQRSLQDRFDAVYALFPRLAERRLQLAGTLSGGEQQMVAIGRAMMSKPKVLLLDEPFLGLAPKVVEEIRQALNTLRGEGLTLILVEQKLDIALPFTRRTHVMIKGQLVLVENSTDLMNSPDLGQLYFRLSQPASV
ncbi:MAG: ABC transporter ATP-binding protein [Betaproteobacteria bacterium]|nr:ABC transporter ATP-binding protein [Betaproteobacteria bacterium]NBY04272.1 ABC transporter ATP-binding protein [Betaproteobacteria bacterium]